MRYQEYVPFVEVRSRGLSLFISGRRPRGYARAILRGSLDPKRTWQGGFAHGESGSSKTMSRINGQIKAASLTKKYSCSLFKVRAANAYCIYFLRRTVENNSHCYMRGSYRSRLFDVKSRTQKLELWRVHSSHYQIRCCLREKAHEHLPTWLQMPAGTSGDHHGNKFYFSRSFLRLFEADNPNDQCIQRGDEICLNAIEHEGSAVMQIFLGRILPSREIGFCT
jgi:hypothetical protein